MAATQLTGRNIKDGSLDITTETTGTLPVSRGGTGAVDAISARTALGLGNSAILSIGTVANTVAAGDDNRIVNAITLTTGDARYRAISYVPTWTEITGKPTYNDKFQAGNWGQHDTHGAFTDFNAINQVGSTFLSGNTNGPPNPSAFGNWYQQLRSLGSQYPVSGAGSYAMQTAIARGGTVPYYNVRFLENSVWGAWQKISAGFADTAGSANAVAWANVSGKPAFGNSSGLNTGTTAGTVATGDHLHDARYLQPTVVNLTIDQSTTTSYSNVGNTNQTVSWLAKVLKSFSGKSNWYDTPDAVLGDAIKLRGRNIDANAPTNGQVLTYEAATTTWKPVTPSATGGSSNAYLEIPVGGNTSSITLTETQWRNDKIELTGVRSTPLEVIIPSAGHTTFINSTTGGGTGGAPTGVDLFTGKLPNSYYFNDAGRINDGITSGDATNNTASSTSGSIQDPAYIMFDLIEPKLFMNYSIHSAGAQASSYGGATQPIYAYIKATNQMTSTSNDVILAGPIDISTAGTYTGSLSNNVNSYRYIRLLVESAGARIYEWTVKEGSSAPFYTTVKGSTTDAEGIVIKSHGGKKTIISDGVYAHVAEVKSDFHYLTVDQSTGQLAIDASVSNSFEYTMSQSIVMPNPINLEDGQQITIKLKQNSNFGNSTISSWASSWAFGSTVGVPVLSTGAGKIDIITAVWDASVSRLYVTSFVKGY